ncbi:OmpA family protein [Mucilaginibacter sp. BJC16-A38]|uniref:OmpA family protein n=1 Tax=Mucilaginibacter phenanthrenivorans TaxID=1234842 RepID=UPI002158545C|nr:OmpA family protein [Mucilaginibacter phenanthrenivorans]MCR8556661.1 OmpA family protein [Mucilaginibacter phenanthrenivorans]
MKINLKKTALLLTGILTCGKLFAQVPDTTQTSADYVKPFAKDNSYRTWSIGFSGGVLSSYTILGSNKHLDFTSPNAQLGYGGYIKKQITPAFGIEGDLLAGKLTSDNSQPDAVGKTYDSFSTKLRYALSLGANVTVGNISWHDNAGAIQPYVTAGGGIIGYKPVLTANGTSSNFKTTDNGVINEFFIPIGVGLKINVAKGINIDLGYQVNFVYSDNLDGYNYGTNNDKFSYAHIGLEFAIGNKSKPQMAVYNPVSSMRAEYMMENQNTRAQLQSQIDAQKVQNDQLKADLATTNATLAKFTADSDGDGVADFYDKCPNTPAGTKVDGAGCPLPVAKPEVKVYVTEDDRRVAREAVKNLEFDFGKATIRQHSDESLNKLAQLMVAKKFSLKLSGYTDNVGSVDANLKLSRDRAEAVKTYLATQGVDPTKITADGYGKASPIASNKTAKGRQQNRRVEFSLN